MFRLRLILPLMMALFLGSVAAAADNQAIVTRLVAEQLKVDPAAVDVDTPLSAVGRGADSLAVVEIFMAIEKTLRVHMSDATVAKILGPHTTEELPAKITVRKLTEMVAIAKPK